MTCAKENISQHYLGPDHGFGCISNDEALVLAVFGSTRPIDNIRLSPEAFSTKQLHRGEFSLARQKYTARHIFETYVVAPKVANGDPFLGVAMCAAERLRSICPPVLGTKLSMRGVCVLDKVVSGEHDGHAALEFCEAQQNLSPSQRGRLRSIIVIDLANAFGDIRSISDCLS